MARLRDPNGGCPWDLEQDFATIAPYTIEEAYEVADAIEGGRPEKIRDELGDLLFQVVFHARMAQEKGWFDFDGVAEAIATKLIRRHPHVFGDARPQGNTAINKQWEDLKEIERAHARTDHSTQGSVVLADVPRALPALTRAAKLGKRAARVGFDWPDPRGVRAKVDEELREVDEAVENRLLANASAAPEPDAHIVEEFGDVLFSLVNWGRHLNLDPEEALRAANGKFEKRFAAMEAVARARGLDLKSLSAADWDALWTEAKTGPKL
jgi:MazG family protein